MKFYLRFINPIVSLAVLFFCLYAASYSNNKIEELGVFKGGLQTYFLAKGIFCSSALFILGRILLVLLEKPDSTR